MDGLVFQPLPAPRATHPARADIACFVGFIPLRAGVLLSASEISDLVARGWVEPPAPGTTVPASVLLHVPVTVDPWASFDRLFAWNTRPLDSAATDFCTAALGAAVRSFFAQGGRRCHIVRVGDPLPVDAAPDLRRNALTALLPENQWAFDDRTAWRGMSHVFGLPDTSFLCLPDLPELLGVTPAAINLPPPPAAEECFVPFAEATESNLPRPSQTFTVGYCDAAGYEAWAAFVRHVSSLLDRHAHEVQFIAALPRPLDATAIGAQARSASATAAMHAAREAQRAVVDGLNTEFVQLAYPWLRTATSTELPGACEAPDGTLAGVLAHHAVSRGTWRSALHTPVPGVDAVVPVLDRATLEGPLLTKSPERGTFRERLTLFGPSPTGIMLLSDVTTHPDDYRSANLKRLVSAIIRAARIVGEESVFENNGEPLWRHLVDRFHDLLTELWRDGIFAGASPAEAFEVVCDRTTISQADLDAGRAIVSIAFTAAAPIERIVVHLALDQGGHVSLLGKDADLRDA